MSGFELSFIIFIAALGGCGVGFYWGWKWGAKWGEANGVKWATDRLKEETYPQ
jgi:hypothetical protein